MLVRLSHSANAQYPIEVTLLGIVMLVRFLQSANALFPIDVTLLGIVMLVRFSQPSNAPFPIDVTLLGIVTLVRLVHYLFYFFFFTESKVIKIGFLDLILSNHYSSKKLFLVLEGKKRDFQILAGSIE